MIVVTLLCLIAVFGCNQVFDRNSYTASFMETEWTIRLNDDGTYDRSYTGHAGNRTLPNVGTYTRAAQTIYLHPEVQSSFEDDYHILYEASSDLLVDMRGHRYYRNRIELPDKGEYTGCIYTALLNHTDSLGRSEIEARIGLRRILDQDTTLSVGSVGVVLRDGSVYEVIAPHFKASYLMYSVDYIGRAARHWDVLSNDVYRLENDSLILDTAFKHECDTQQEF